ncbi:hypothetical protein M885DRAFT_517915 [Pelagophyceae sp. CCMP2097]|nr:hypothetical protein M885DRAFT_517915 [Pelagophyceae sp. CCMP2097]
MRCAVLSSLLLGAGALVAPSTFGQRRGVRAFADMAAEEVTVSLEKPMGILFAEIVKDQSKGLYVKEIMEGGSAAECADVTTKLVLVSVAGVECTTSSFDEVMASIVAAESPVQMAFRPRAVSARFKARAAEAEAAAVVAEAIADAAPAVAAAAAAEEEAREKVFCLLQVVKPKGGGTSFVTADEGANLRLSLMGGGADVYDFMGKMTNCNGGGQCGTCVVAVSDDEFDERPEWMADKLKGRPANHRLACQTVCKGTGATIEVTPPKK